MKKILRGMAWERAKGELQAMLATYQNESAKFEAMDRAIEEFVKQVEEEGWAE